MSLAQYLHMSLAGMLECQLEKKELKNKALARDEGIADLVGCNSLVCKYRALGGVMI